MGEDAATLTNPGTRPPTPTRRGRLQHTNNSVQSDRRTNHLAEPSCPRNCGECVVELECGEGRAEDARSGVQKWSCEIQIDTELHRTTGTSACAVTRTLRQDTSVTARSLGRYCPCLSVWSVAEDVTRWSLPSLQKTGVFRQFRRAGFADCEIICTTDCFQATKVQV